MFSEPDADEATPSMDRSVEDVLPDYQQFDPNVVSNDVLARIPIGID